MSSAASVKITAHAPVKGGALPLLVYFEDEHAVRLAIASITRYRRTTFADSFRQPEELERVVLCSSEAALQQHQSELRKPNTRVVALSTHRFRDARVDGLIYGYMP